MKWTKINQATLYLSLSYLTITLMITSKDIYKITILDKILDKPSTANIKASSLDLAKKIAIKTAMTHVRTIMTQYEIAESELKEKEVTKNGNNT